MKSESTSVRIDKQGRIVVPQGFREGLVDPPGELLLSRTPDGLLLSPIHPVGELKEAKDGLLVLKTGRAITNTEALDGIDSERAER